MPESPNATKPINITSIGQSGFIELPYSKTLTEVTFKRTPSDGQPPYSICINNKLYSQSEFVINVETIENDNTYLELKFDDSEYNGEPFTYEIRINKDKINKAGQKTDPDYVVSYNPIADSNSEETKLITNKINKILDSSKYNKSVLDPAFSSGLLVKTNPYLTGNIKLNVTEDCNAYFDTFKVSDVLSKKQYRKQKIDLTNSYSYDIRRIYKSVPRDDFYSPRPENFDNYKIELNKYNFVDLTYSYGTETNDDPLYTENYSLLAPLYINNKLPDYFCVFRVNTDSEDIDTIISNASLVTYYPLSEKTTIGKYLHNHLKEISSIKSPYSIQATQDSKFKKTNENTITGISIDAGVIVDIKETTYKQDTILENDKDTPIQFDNLQSYLSSRYQHFNLISHNIINLCFMFDDPNVDPLSSNRYIGFYLYNNDFIDVDTSSIENGLIVHKKRNDIVNTSKVSDPYNNLFNRAAVHDLLIFALSDNGITRLTQREDYLKFLNTKILNTPKEAILSVQSRKLRKEIFPYSEFITFDIAHSIEAGNHLRFIIPSVKTNVTSDTNIERDCKSKITNPIITKTEPYIFDIIAVHDTKLYSDGYTRTPVIIKDKASALYPANIYKGTFLDPNAEYDDFKKNARVLIVPKTSKQEKWFRLNTTENKVEKDKYLTQKDAYHKVTSFDLSRGGKVDLYRQGIPQGKDLIGYTAEPFKTLTTYVDEMQDTVAGFVSSHIFNKKTSKPTKDDGVLQSKNAIEFISKPGNLVFEYQAPATVISTGFLVDSTDNNIHANIDYAFMQSVKLADKSEQTDRIVEALRIAIAASGLEVGVYKAGPNSITFASNYKDCIFQQIYPIKSLDKRDDIPESELSSLSIYGISNIDKKVSELPYAKNKLLNRLKISYLLGLNTLPFLGQRKYSAFSFIKNGESFVEFRKPQNLLIDSSLLYRKFNYEALDFEYANILPFKYSQIKTTNSIIKSRSNADEVIRILKQIKSPNTQSDDLDYVRKYDSAFNTIDIIDGDLYAIKSPLDANKYIINSSNQYDPSNTLKLYNTYAHTVSVMGIANIMNLEFLYRDEENKAYNFPSSNLTPITSDFIFRHRNVNSNPTSVVTQSSIDSLFTLLNNDGGNKEETNEIPIIPIDKSLSSKKVKTNINGALGYNGLLDLIISGNLDNYDINSIVRPQNQYSITSYNVQSRILSFPLYGMLVELVDKSINGFKLSNYNNYKVQYIPVDGKTTRSTIYFVFDKNNKVLNVLHFISSTNQEIDGNKVITYDKLKDPAGILIKNEKLGGGQRSFYSGLAKSFTNTISNISTGINQGANIYTEFNPIHLLKQTKDFYDYAIIDSVGPDSVETKKFDSIKIKDIKSKLTSDPLYFIFSSGDISSAQDSDIEIKTSYTAVKYEIGKDNDKFAKIITVPVDYNFNILSSQSTISKELEDYIGLDLYQKNIKLANIDSITEYQRIIFNLYEDANSYLNVKKKTILGSAKNLLSLYKYYKRGLPKTVSTKDSVVETSDIKSYFNGRSIALKGKTDALINAKIPLEEYDIISNNAIKFNLNQIFFDNVKSINSNLSDLYITEKLSTYYDFTTSRTLVTIYKSKDPIAEDITGTLNILTPENIKLNYRPVTNIKSDIVYDGGIYFYSIEVPDKDDYAYFIDVTFIPKLVDLKDAQFRS